MRRVSQSNYRADPHYPRVVRAVNEILASGGNVAPVEVFVRMGLLARQDVEDWQSGACRTPITPSSSEESGVLRIRWKSRTDNRVRKPSGK